MRQNRRIIRREAKFGTIHHCEDRYDPDGASTFTLGKNLTPLQSKNSTLWSSRNGADPIPFTGSVPALTDLKPALVAAERTGLLGAGEDASQENAVEGAW